MRRTSCKNPLSRSAHSWWMNFGVISLIGILVKDPNQPGVAKTIQAFERILGLKFGCDFKARPTLLYQSRLARGAEFVPVTGFDSANFFKIKRIQELLRFKNTAKGLPERLLHSPLRCEWSRNRQFLLKQSSDGCICKGERS